MKTRSVNRKRILAIDPCTKGFGFVVLEGPEQLIDFGLKVMPKGKDKNKKCLRQIAGLVDYYQPDSLVVEDYQAKESRRRNRIRALLRDIELIAFENKVKFQKVSLQSVIKVFSPEASMTKYQVANHITSRFPQLKSYLPAARKPWMSEDERMRVFDAVALACVLYFKETKQTLKLPPN
jgi:hypothetical protein